MLYLYYRTIEVLDEFGNPWLFESTLYELASEVDCTTISFRSVQTKMRSGLTCLQMKSFLTKQYPNHTLVNLVKQNE
jgi:hypothetical protein